MQVHFAIPLWGDHHLTTFFEAGLPSQLAAGNLFGFPQPASYHIYTSQKDVESIKAHPLYPSLEALLPVEFFLIDDEIGVSKWSTIRYCHRQQVQRADAADAALFFLCADQMWSCGSFSRAAQRLQEGYDAVVCAGPRASWEKVRKRLPTLSGAGFPASQVVRSLLDCPHPETVTWFWDDPNYFQYPTYIYFTVPGEGILAFCYILHPVAVKPRIKGAAFYKVFDQDWLTNACPLVNRIYVVQDSQEICHIELSPHNMELPSQPANPHLDPIQAMTWYAEACYNNHHREFVKHPVCLRAGAMTEESWRIVEERGRRVIDAVDAGLSLPDRTLLHLNPENLSRRINMRNWFAPDSMSVADKALLDQANKLLDLHRHREPWIAPQKEKLDGNQE